MPEETIYPTQSVFFLKKKNTDFCSFCVPLSIFYCRSVLYHFKCQMLNCVYSVQLQNVTKKAQDSILNTHTHTKREERHSLHIPHRKHQRLNEDNVNEILLSQQKGTLICSFLFNSLILLPLIIMWFKCCVCNVSNSCS